MKIIDTSVISTVKQYPGLANVNNQSIMGGDPTKMQGLDFLQQNVLDMVDALCKAMIVDTTKATWLWSKSTMSFLNIYITGYVYYGGEVFFVPNQMIAPMMIGHYLACNINPNPTDASPNPPTTLSDTSTVSIHNQRTISFVWVTSGIGDLPNLSDWTNVQNNFQWAVPTIHIVGGAGEPVFGTGWSTTTRLAFYILGNEVTIQGTANYVNAAASLIFAIPNGYRPLYDSIFPVWQTLAGINFIYISATTGQVSYIGSTSPGPEGIAFTAKYTIL